MSRGYGSKRGKVVACGDLRERGKEMMTQTRNYLVKPKCLKVHLQGPRGGHTMTLRFEQLKNFKPPGDGSALVNHFTNGYL
ncbi:hypothetical protein HanIR_Chr07g0324651 [Helianthus annuus]|nr:hypothetical protein HanIR_Chr07g0324651 [Helianthus annuus]